MDKDLKKMINEVLDKTFADAPEKLVERGIREIQYDICPHCKQEIYEKHEYTEDGGVTWRHSDCKGLISRPETPMEQISREWRPFIAAAQQQRKQARKALGLESVTRGFPPLDVLPEHPNDLPLGGDKKYCQDNQKQAAPFPLNTTGLGEALNSTKSERDEVKVIEPKDYTRFMDKAIIATNLSNVPLKMTITQLTSTVEGASASSYIIRVENV